MKNFIIFLLACSLATPGYGGSCSEPITPINKGTAATCNGYLISPEFEAKMESVNEQNKLLQQESDVKDKQILLYKNNADLYNQMAQQESQKADLWRQNAEASSQKLTSAENNRGYKDFLLVMAGVALACAGAWAVRQVR